MDDASGVHEENTSNASDLTRIAWPLLLHKDHNQRQRPEHTAVADEKHEKPEKSLPHIQLTNTFNPTETNNFLNSRHSLSLISDEQNNNNDIKNNPTTAFLSASIVLKRRSEAINESERSRREEGKSIEEVEVINPATFAVISRASSTTSSALRLSRFLEDLPCGHNIPVFSPTATNFLKATDRSVNSSADASTLLAFQPVDEDTNREIIKQKTVNGCFASESDKKFTSSNNNNHNNKHKLEFSFSNKHRISAKPNKQPIQLFYLGGENKSAKKKSGDNYQRGINQRATTGWLIVSGRATISGNCPERRSTAYSSRKQSTSEERRRGNFSTETKIDNNNNCCRKSSTQQQQQQQQQQHWSCNNSETTTSSTAIRDSGNSSASDYRKISESSSPLVSAKAKIFTDENRLQRIGLKEHQIIKQKDQIRSFTPQFFATKYRREKRLKKNLRRVRRIGLPSIYKQQQPTLKTQPISTITTRSEGRKLKLEIKGGIPASLLKKEVKPVNGMIKTYADSKRNFSRPYSAKTVFFYKDGDEYFTGLRVPITKVRYRTMDSLLDRLNESIALPFGVRRLHTPYGRTPIQSVDQLQHLGKYVATSSKTARGLDLEALERRKRKRDENSARSHFSTATSARGSNLRSFKYDNNTNNLPRKMSQQGGSLRQKASTGQLGLTYLPVAKQMFFVLNGNPSTVYRTVLNPLKLRELDTLLEEVSEGLRAAIFRFFSFDGERIKSVEQLLTLKEARVLAVPRNQRPILQGDEAFPQLPPIFNWTTTTTRPTASITTNSAPNREAKPRRRFSTTSSASISKLFADEQQNGTDHNTDDMAAIAPTDIHKTSGVYEKTATNLSFRPLKHASTNVEPLPRFPYTSPKMEQDSPFSGLLPLEPAPLNGNNVGVSDNSNSIGSNTNTNTNTVDSDSGRPRSVLDLGEELNAVTTYARPGVLNRTRKRRSLSDPTKSSIRPQISSKRVANPRTVRDLKLFRSKSLKRIEVNTLHPANTGATIAKSARSFANESSLQMKTTTLKHAKSQDAELGVAKKRQNRVGTPPIGAAKQNDLPSKGFKSRLQKPNTVVSTVSRMSKLIKAESVSENDVTRELTEITKSAKNDEFVVEHDGDEDDDYPEHEEMRDTYFREHNIDLDREFEELEREHSEIMEKEESQRTARNLEPVDEDDDEQNHQNEHEITQISEFDLKRMHTIREEGSRAASLEENQRKESQSELLPPTEEVNFSSNSLAEIVAELNKESSSYFPAMAATIIQSRFRGFLARKKVREIRFSDTVQIIHHEDYGNETTSANIDPENQLGGSDDKVTNNSESERDKENTEKKTNSPENLNNSEEIAESDISFHAENDAEILENNLPKENTSPDANDIAQNDQKQIEFEGRKSPYRNLVENIHIQSESHIIQEEFEPKDIVANHLAEAENLYEPTSPSSDVQGGEIYVDALIDPEPDTMARMWNSPQNPKLTYTYTVTVKTGNRWAADTEADLYLVMYGNSMQSERIVLRQEYVNWLQSSEPKFRQNQTDLFRIEVPAKLGIIRRITVGHEHAGYGAGIFVERILITEEDENEFGDRADFDEDGDALDSAQMVGAGTGPRQFLFLCNKWLDSGQVDAKLERTFRLSAFCYVNSTPNSARRTKGRWEFVFHNGTASGQGGTTSNLRLIGYGTRGQSTTSDVYDTRMNKVPSESLIQVDFGNIGDLLKVRVEIDGVGYSPDYFLNFVVMKDLDTEERFVVMCGKWLRWKNAARGAQPFRELLAFHMGVEPLPLIAYEGKLRIVPSKIQCFEPMVEVEFHGDLGETGIFTVPTVSDQIHDENLENDDENSKIEINFKVEAVSIGRVYGARIYFQPTKIGAELFEGFCALQNIFENQLMDFESTASDWLVSSVLLRESLHTPYRYVLTQRKLLPQQNQQETSAAAQPYVMDLISSEMEGVATRAGKREKKKRAESNWVLSMLLGSRSTLLPEVTLCGERGDRAIVMRNLDPTPVDDIISYQLKSSKVGNLRKVRVSADGKKRLNVNAEENGETTPNFVAIQKMRLCDTANGDELRFPSADIELGANSVYEFSAIWPDYPPNSIVIYVVRIRTGNSNISRWDFGVRLNLRGQFGDVGQRALVTRAAESNAEGSPGSAHNFFQENSQSAFEFEAVSIGELKIAEITIDSREASFSWECKELIVTDSQTQANSVFKFPRRFSARCKHQTAVAQKL